MKKLIAVFFILSFLFTLAGCQNSNKALNTTDEKPDSSNFKNEYEALNGQLNDNFKKIRKININENNPVIYASYDDIVNLINNKESFIVYFGFANCPWCRSCLETFLLCAENNNIDKIYYVDVENSRDKYEYQENNLTCVQNAENGYLTLLKIFDNFLSEYTINDSDGNEIDVGEKRIYAPNFIAIKEGVPVCLKSESILLKDAYGEITPEIERDMINNYNELFSSLIE